MNTISKIKNYPLIFIQKDHSYFKSRYTNFYDF